MEEILFVLDGRFGKKVLKPKYRKVWRFLTKATLLALATIAFFIALQIMTMCSDCINNLR